jgi:pyruvate,orthophosphate dikinase
MKVRANADTPLDARTARAFGAEGIGLCRTEHMFFEEERIQAVREMILADDAEGRSAALSKLLPFQREDFVGIFREMRGLPVTIRLLDPPLHEFLPTETKQLEELSRSLGVPVQKLAQRTKDLHEFNPMLGHRGVRLAITFPEIYAMQVRAILEAASQVVADGIHVHPEIMIPLAITRAELERTQAITAQIAAELAAAGKTVTYSFGTMIERPSWPASSRRWPSSSPSAPTISRRPPWVCRATTPASSCPRTWTRASCPGIRSCPSTRRGWASS